MGTNCRVAFNESLVLSSSSSILVLLVEIKHGLTSLAAPHSIYSVFSTIPTALHHFPQITALVYMTCQSCQIKDDFQIEFEFHTIHINTFYL